MRFLIFIIVIGAVVLGGTYYYYGELPTSLSLGPSETCDAIVRRQSERVPSDVSTYNTYADGIHFFFNLCFFR